MSFRVATWNVLATAYIRPEWYRAVAPALLDPARRVPAVVSHVEGLAADLLCLQEVEGETFAALGRRLGPLGYEGHLEKKGGGRPDGCAIFFRAAAFIRREGQRLEYHDGGERRGGDSGHVALLLCLEHQGRRLGVANTHLRWDRPGTPRDAQVGYRQAEELLEACQRFTPPCDGWLVCGDFNRTPRSDVLTAFRRAGYDYAHAGRPDLRSSVANGRASLIDYILHTAALRARPSDPPAVTDDTALPSEEQPSDHLALVAEIDWA